ncbi:MAG: Ldh family oxidoreductase [Lautropia sp.]
MTPRYDAAALRRFGAALVTAAGVRPDMAEAMADVLVEADLIGYPTHGLAFLPSYLDRIARGKMAKDGEITVVADAGATFAWQANRLPGAWVMRRAIASAIARAQRHPVVVATIANGTHLGCLQVYLPALTERGLLAIVSATNPGIASVAPFGGVDPVLTSNPIAIGIPTPGDPILIDVSTSLVTNAAVAGHAAAGTTFDSDCLLDHEGRPTRDPAALASKPPGTILPLGGTDFGHKGFGLGLMVEALTLALPGAGRATATDAFGQGAFLQVIDPRGFGGADAFLAETGWIAERCRASRVPAGAPPVRMPGERALQRRAAALRDGVPLAAPVRDRLAAAAGTAGIAFPDPL